MIPPGRRKRQEGNPRPLWAFRPPQQLQLYIETATAKAERSAVIVEMLEEAKDARDALGEDYYELLKLAGQERSTVGSVLGRLAKAALKKR